MSSSRTSAEAAPAALFTQLYGHLPRKICSAAFAEQEIACLDLVDEAAAAFRAGRLTDFDARVGDGNCQVLTHLVAELSLDRGFAAAVAATAPRAAAARRALAGWTDRRMRPLSSVLTLAHRDDALLHLSEEQVLLANCYVVKKVTRDGDRRVEQQLRRIGGRSAFERARRSISRISDAHVDAAAERAWAYWVRHGADRLAEDVHAMRETLRPARRVGSFRVRVSYSSLRVVLHRLWQQRIHVAIQSYVPFAAHAHQVTLLYAPCAERRLEFTLVEAAGRCRIGAAPAMVVLGISDPTASFPGLAADDFYAMRARMPAASCQCCRDAMSRLVRRMRAVGMTDLVCAGEAMKPDSRELADLPLGGIPAGARARFLAELERHRRLADTAGLHADDASCFRAVHVYPAALGSLS